MGAPPEPGPRRGRGLVITGVVLIVLGVVLGVVAVVTGVTALAGLEVQPVSESAVVEAEAGEELAIYRTSGAGGGACAAVGPDGVPLEARRPLGTERLTLDGVEYVVHEELTVAVGGAQSVRCTATGFAVGPRVGVFGLVGTILGGVFGGLALIAIGIVVLVIGATRRRGRTTPPAGGPWPGQPPGPAPGSWPQGPPPWSQGHPQAPPPQWPQ